MLGANGLMITSFVHEEVLRLKTPRAHVGNSESAKLFQIVVRWIPLAQDTYCHCVLRRTTSQEPWVLMVILPKYHSHAVVLWAMGKVHLSNKFPEEQLWSKTCQTHRSLTTMVPELAVGEPMPHVRLVSIHMIGESLLRHSVKRSLDTSLHELRPHPAAAKLNQLQSRVRSLSASCFH